MWAAPLGATTIDTLEYDCPKSCYTVLSCQADPLDLGGGILATHSRLLALVSPQRSSPYFLGGIMLILQTQDSLLPEL